MGCAQANRPLYNWGQFPKQQYQYLSREGFSPLQQIQAMQEHMDRTQSEQLALPPGFRAHLGILHLQAGNPQVAKAMWLAEKAAFPESAVYIDTLLKRLNTDQSS